LTPGGIYHVTARGNRKQRIFLADTDREVFIGLLARIATQMKWQCHAYCLMENHYHLVTQIPEPNLSVGLQLLNGRYAQLFNGRYALTGHVFQGRFHSVAVEDHGHLLELWRYLALNPVRAGLCQHPEEWPWSSYRAVMGKSFTPSFLNVARVLELCGPSPERGRENLRQFISNPRASL